MMENKEGGEGEEVEAKPVDDIFGDDEDKVKDEKEDIATPTTPDEIVKISSLNSIPCGTVFPSERLLYMRIN